MTKNLPLGNVRPLKRVSIVEQVVEATRQQILDEDAGLAPGTPLKEQDLAAAYGVSRPTAVAALRELIKWRVLTKTPNHTALVAEVTEEGFRDLLVVRKVTEMALLDALSEATDGQQLVTPEEAMPLRSLVTDLTGDTPLSRHAVITNEVDFHTALVTLGQSPHIDRVHTGYIHEFHLGMVTLGKELDPKVLAVQHGAILEGLMLNREAAASAMDAHLAHLASD